MPELVAQPVVGRIAFIQVDCRNPAGLAAFWGALLAVEIQEQVGQCLCLQPQDVASPGLCFQAVPEAKTSKNRVHLDIAVSDIDRAAHRVKELGGGQVSPEDVEEHGWRYRVMTDPEGNAFCLTA
ncbi:MAG: VOC family protein [Chloroflexota bacterium]|nr:VOC family protein [Chloroflexota bacterium]